MITVTGFLPLFVSFSKKFVSMTINDNTAEPSYIDPLFAQTIPTPVVLAPEKVKVRFSESKSGNSSSILDIKSNNNK